MTVRFTRRNAAYSSAHECWTGLEIASDGPWKRTSKRPQRADVCLRQIRRAFVGSTGCFSVFDTRPSSQYKKEPFWYDIRMMALQHQHLKITPNSLFTTVSTYNFVSLLSVQNVSTEFYAVDIWCKTKACSHFPTPANCCCSLEAGRRISFTSVQKT